MLVRYKMKYHIKNCLRATQWACKALGLNLQAHNGPADSQGSATELGPEACIREELEGAAAAGFINQCGCPSASEVGLNLPHRTCASAPPLVPGRGTNWY